MAKGAKTGGRKKGTPNKASAAIRDAALKAGITPLEYMMNLMRKPDPKDADALTKVQLDGLRFEAAKAAAPYVHPRLAAVEHTGKDGGPLQIQFAQEDASVL